MNKFTLCLLLLVNITLLAHEGHNLLPGSFKSLHGGVVHNGKELNLEVVNSGQDVYLYPTGHDSKDIPRELVIINAKVIPKKGRPYEIKLSKEKMGFTGKVDLNGANRLPVEILIRYNSKTDKFIIQIEE